MTPREHFLAALPSEVLPVSEFLLTIRRVYREIRRSWSYLPMSEAEIQQLVEHDLNTLLPSDSALWFTNTEEGSRIHLMAGGEATYSTDVLRNNITAVCSALMIIEHVMKTEKKPEDLRSKILARRKGEL